MKLEKSNSTRNMRRASWRRSFQYSLPSRVFFTSSSQRSLRPVNELHKAVGRRLHNPVGILGIDDQLRHVEVDAEAAAVQEGRVGVHRVEAGLVRASVGGFREGALELGFSTVVWPAGLVTVMRSL